MEQVKIEDIVGWDVVNWSEAIAFWSNHLPDNSRSLTCLELGGNKGGLSLWLASMGHKVICSDLHSPIEHAQPIHNRYGLEGNISYQAINATDIPYSNHFDVAVFKSILGGISRNNNDALKQKTIDEIYDSLKPGGYLLFAENLEASMLHRFFRKRFVKWGSNWNYLKFSEVVPLLKGFTKVDYATTGFFGTFGRTEQQRRLLGKLDKVIKPIIPRAHRYIVYGVAQKSDSGV